MLTFCRHYFVNIYFTIHINTFIKRSIYITTIIFINICNYICSIATELYNREATSIAVVYHQQQHRLFTLATATQ